MIKELLEQLAPLDAQIAALRGGAQDEESQMAAITAHASELAEPGALIGFAGPRVIEQTIGERLPEGFQRSEFQLEHGFVDKVVPRSELRATLIQLLQLHAGGRKTE